MPIVAVKKSPVICVDPGTRVMGWAHFSGASPVLKGSGFIRCAPGKDLSWIDHVDSQVRQFESLVNRIGLGYAANPTTSARYPGMLICELPGVQGGAAGEAAKNSGDILKLMALVFALRERATSLGLDTQLVPVNIWKGQVPKEITQMRVKKHWGWLGSDHNEADAVGIGDWYYRKVK